MMKDTANRQKKATAFPLRRRNRRKWVDMIQRAVAILEKEMNGEHQ